MPIAQRPGHPLVHEAPEPSAVGRLFVMIAVFVVLLIGVLMLGIVAL